jgi:hypothetical protein
MRGAPPSFSFNCWLLAIHVAAFAETCREDAVYFPFAGMK